MMSECRVHLASLALKVYFFHNSCSRLPLTFYPSAIFAVCKKKYKRSAITHHPYYPTAKVNHTYTRHVKDSNANSEAFWRLHYSWGGLSICGALHKIEGHECEKHTLITNTEFCPALPASHFIAPLQKLSAIIFTTSVSFLITSLWRKFWKRRQPSLIPQRVATPITIPNSNWLDLITLESSPV